MAKISTVVLLLELASITLGQPPVDVVVDCLNGNHSAGRACPDGAANGVCVVDTPKHHERLFIIFGKYGFVCEGANDTARLRFARCIVEIKAASYKEFSIETLNNFNDSDDANYMWKNCYNLLNNRQSERKAVTGTTISLVSAYKRSFYYVVAEFFEPNLRQVHSLRFEDGLVARVPFASLARIPDPIDLFAQTCTRNFGTFPIAGVSHFVDYTVVYTCYGVADGSVPALLGCLTAMPLIREGFINLYATLKYINITTVPNLNKIYSNVARLSQNIQQPANSTDKMSNKTLCAGISMAIMNPRNQQAISSYLRDNSIQVVSRRGVSTIFNAKFYT